MPLTNAYRDFLAAATVGEPVTPFNAANAYLGVGNGTTAFASTQTDLQGSSKVRKAMDAGYPVRSGNQITFRATFGNADANFAWEEWGIFNAPSGGVMLNRKVESLGTKGSGATWILTVTITLNV